MERIKRIIINKKKYDVALCPLGLENKEYKLSAWVCAYVILPKWKGKESPEMCLRYCTYYNDGVYGIDTNHAHNVGMTLEEKEKDAIMQITQLIKDFNKQNNLSI